MGNATAAGVPHSIDGVDYELSPLRFEDFEYMGNWLKAQAIEAGRLSIPPGATDEEERKMMVPVIEVANRISIFSSEGLEQMLSPSAIARLLWLMVRRNHPSVTLDQCARWIFDVEKRRDLIAKITMLIHSSTGGVKPAGGGEKPSRPSVQTKRSRRSSRSASSHRI